MLKLTADENRVILKEFDMNLEINVSAEELFKLGDFPVTNTFLLSIVLAIVIFFILFFAFRKKKVLPGPFQNFFEFLLESILNFVDSITQDKKKTEEIFPLAATLFIFILFSNLLEILPGIGVFRFLRSPSSDLNFTLALAIFSIFFVNFAAVKRLGFFTYLKKYLNFKNPVLFFVGILEGSGELTRIVSLGVRLFGNLFAGETLLIVVSALFSFLLPLPFLALELLVAFVQALIFSSLIIIFYSTAMSHGE